VSGFRVLWSRHLEDGTIVQVVRGTDGRKQIEIVSDVGSSLAADSLSECIRFEVRTAADRHTLDMAALELLEGLTT
jgi:hypothetical protein